MIALGLIIATKCLFGAICIVIFDFQEKAVKFLGLWLVAAICSLKFFLITAVFFPIIVFGAYALINSLKNEKIKKFIDFVNTVIHKKESFIQKINTVMERIRS
ncbi:hypothetical protein A2331_02125 [Candidatus Falkowbacteria bacterium RIFOXYB2_FULL_34_18]|uniref:Uncharacterized protein n=1 Tax=Candidatus Falkowbacteria bacterium RIFOXYD2_FULL_34_120 TaxID=1798007 RepID=A0A1F5TQK1_9BACT|nr:MAG: hypothetical protein A2331_02125 [Candidatus Falkowbacteria bacterium RIFOXYB2_FULL_34_18]OGF29534.1 MAG: hypothetical protein A2500_02405 [Candidatus Falkowbacteria bacterium RIFOXYC12_FULL_34_55]OGF36856.1 MAG: hypothetical protein A2466_06565 [Candidatus Falkowbacteria bacterium RIFOXYC2_FULL_34_220]OGF39055.1 MAG: hypothetical protein A2515_04570 [Candidatus Falkowbacteria bacterium RIFOXYD12_FULL_34_57]OGF41292.1 MAG: hypothetical protein A2531_00320 [Candidatus Falkowbacteria bact